MSRRKNQQRAEQGWIFRDGRLVKVTTHVEQQKVDEAVEEFKRQWAGKTVMVTTKEHGRVAMSGEDAAELLAKARRKEY